MLNNEGRKNRMEALLSHDLVLVGIVLGIITAFVFVHALMKINKAMETIIEIEVHLAKMKYLLEKIRYRLL